jgi:hypothetical protein
MAVAMDYRVSSLEKAMAEMAREVAQTSREMREFKDEMGEFKDEMHEFKIEMRREWGQLANKLGTMAEDLVAPSVSRILRETVGCSDDQIDLVAVRTRRRSTLDRSRMQEFDVVAACGEYALVNETKSSLHPEDVDKFIKMLEGVREFFPEFADKKVIGAIGSLYVDHSLVAHGERYGLIVLGFGDDVMQVLNSEGFTPKAF